MFTDMADLDGAGVGIVRGSLEAMERDNAAGMCEEHEDACGGGAAKAETGGAVQGCRGDMLLGGILCSEFEGA
jgi:hypothetical protein